MSTCYSKNPNPTTPAYRDITQEIPPSLTESDRKILKSLLEGCLGSLDYKNVVCIIREQLKLPNRLTASEKERIEEIAITMDWSLWCGQFKYWLASGRWFRSIPGVT